MRVAPLEPGGRRRMGHGRQGEEDATVREWAPGGREPVTPVSRWAAAVGPCWDEVANDSRNTIFYCFY